MLSQGANCHTSVVTTIGDRLRAARERKGWSRPELALEVGCSVEQIKRLEKTGDAPPVGSRYFDRMIGILGVDLAADADAPGLAYDPDDPPVSRANKVQLARAMYELVTAEEPTVSTSGRRKAFSVVDEPSLIESQTGEQGQHPVNSDDDSDDHNGDTPPSAGTSQS